MTPTFPRRPRRWQLALLTVAVFGLIGFGTMRTNVLGVADRFDRLGARVEAFIDPPPDRSTVPTVVVTPRPSPSSSPLRTPTPDLVAEPRIEPRIPTPTPTPVVRNPVDIAIVNDPPAVFASQLTEKDCAVAATQMVLTILGLGDASPQFQTQIHDRIGEWESWDDSHNGGWGPAAVSLALASYGAVGYEIRAYDSHTDALRDMAIALSATGKPVVLFPWWGAHTWVMTGYRADADPTLFPDARVSGLYVLDPWYPRVSSIWGASDGPGNFEDLAEMQRNWPVGTGRDGWSRPEGAYPGRDGKFVVLIPTTAEGGVNQ
jgi:hypothetical protein